MRIAIVGILALFVVGCSSGASQEEFDALKAEFETLSAVRR